MRYFLAAIAPLVIMLSSVLALASAHPVAAGVIALDNWGEGVVICGEATVINAGHEADPEVAQLLALAAEMCPTFTK